MIRHKATGAELKWRPTLDGHGADGVGWALASKDDDLIPVFVYPSGGVYGGSVVYGNRSGDNELFRAPTPQTKESMLAKAVELGVVEVIDDYYATVDLSNGRVIDEDPPKDYDAVHWVDAESDRRLAEESGRLLEDARALAIRLFLAGHDDAASALRRLL